ncbi:hypothetical protein [Erwinia mallotivora]|uniref:Uncharacterized protein n=1 Tax=Erwinia mallotivora TaxID=69222 RepID=A0A014MCL9_9GAMM|nr:hypothetical protein [Erwinia mallotivora]EXU75819.1 hypothetical protein BG55_09070 [Erwinia mallotivora]
MLVTYNNGEHRTDSHARIEDWLRHPQMHLALASEQAFRLGTRPVTAGIVQQICRALLTIQNRSCAVDADDAAAP